MLADLRAAFALLTILPFGSAVERKPGYAFAYFPAVGLVLGAILWFFAGLHWPSPALRGFVLLLLWQALRAQPLIAPDGLTLAALAGLLAVVCVAGTAVFLKK